MDQSRSVQTAAQRRASWLEQMCLLTDHTTAKQHCLWDPARSAWIQRRTQMTQRWQTAENTVRWLFNLQIAIIYHGFTVVTLTAPWYCGRIFFLIKCIILMLTCIKGAMECNYSICQGSECAVSGSLDTAHSCPRVFCCVARSSCFYRLRAFVLSCAVLHTAGVFSLAVCSRVFMSCVNTWLMSFLISCVFVSCFAHGWWIVCWPCACVLFCVSTWLLS